jgi:P-type conjugative transfer protein TrbG
MKKQIFLIAAVLSAMPLCAQQQAPPPSAADYHQAAAILAGSTPAAPPAAVHARRKPKPEISGTISAGAMQLVREVSLPANASLALSLSEGFQVSGAPPTTGPDGRVLYTYGQGVATVVCSTLQVCELDLEPGETMTKDALDWGDHRFEVVARTAGSGAEQFTYLVVKPTEPGLDTTMTVGTDKRLYYVRLVSTDHGHMARVAFTYPDEEAKKLKAAEEAKRAEAERQRAEAERLAKLSTDKPLRNWNYEVKLHGKDAQYLKPEKIADDGVHTHITLPEEARHRGLPVVQIADARGPIPANARWDGNELIIDAVFEQACLVEGVGRKQQRACITNQGLNSNGVR